MLKKDILLCGVGGQGTVLASKLIAAAAMQEGAKVHSAETIGMAQRGGPVTSHVRIGEDAYSPLIPLGCADVIIAFEPAEAVRNLAFLKDGEAGTVIVNSVPVMPVTESLKSSGYTGGEMIDYLKEKCKNVIVVDSDELCREFGSAKFFNVAILGVASGTGKLGIAGETLLDEIARRVPERFVEINKKAFLKGEQIGVDYET